ncbi:hypothetical protein ABZP36_007597 [Zizania latifolia]
MSCVVGMRFMAAVGVQIGLRERPICVGPGLRAALLWGRPPICVEVGRLICGKGADLRRGGGDGVVMPGIGVRGEKGCVFVYLQATKMGEGKAEGGGDGDTEEDKTGLGRDFRKFRPRRYLATICPAQLGAGGPVVAGQAV